MARTIEDSEYYGTNMLDMKEDGMLIYFQNANGIWKEKGEDFKDSLELLESVGLAYIGVTESLVNERNERAHQVRRGLVK